MESQFSNADCKQTHNPEILQLIHHHPDAFCTPTTCPNMLLTQGDPFGTDSPSVGRLRILSNTFSSISDLFLRDCLWAQISKFLRGKS